jgi:hypothetical protein
MTTGSTQYTERLTRNNTVLLLADHQVGLYTGVRDVAASSVARVGPVTSRSSRPSGVPCQTQ